MQKLHIGSTKITPEILFSPEESIFSIRGISAPENVRSLYYPVIQWLKTFINETVQKGSKVYTKENPFKNILVKLVTIKKNINNYKNKFLCLLSCLTIS